MSIKRFAVIGAGHMGRKRTEAFLATGKATLCGVAARHLTNARKFAQDFNCTTYFDDYKKLAACQPDAVLIEVPHKAQEEMVRWLLDSGYHILIGGPLACSVLEGSKIRQAADEKGLVVEAGYEARYKAVWESTRQYLQDGVLGKLVAINSTAFWAANPNSWYYNQEESGGMPLTHMTYTFINPLRWILGDPLYVSAFSNRVKDVSSGKVNEENCTANILFENNVLCNMTAGFVNPAERPASWVLSFLGTKGIMEVFPSEKGPGSLRILRGKEAIENKFNEAPDPFEIQAQVFLEALNGDNCCRNKPEDTIGDIRVAEAIVRSSYKKKTIQINNLEENQKEY